MGYILYYACQRDLLWWVIPSEDIALRFSKEWGDFDTWTEQLNGLWAYNPDIIKTNEDLSCIKNTVTKAIAYNILNPTDNIYLDWLTSNIVNPLLEYYPGKYCSLLRQQGNRHNIKFMRNNCNLVNNTVYKSLSDEEKQNILTLLLNKDTTLLAYKILQVC